MENDCIDRESHLPYYIQLSEIIRSQIKADLYVPEGKLPSERELCENYGVSRTVVRQALNELEVDNLIKRQKGKGTFLTKEKISEGLVQKLTGFYQDMVERGLLPETKVYYQRVVPADQIIARYLEVQVGSEIVEIKRLRSINSEPILLVNTYIPLSLVPNLENVDLTNQSLYAILDSDYGITISRGRRLIEAVLATEEEAELLGINPGDPLIMLDSVSYSDTGHVIEYYHAVHRGDRSRFEVELVRPGNED